MSKLLGHLRSAWRGITTGYREWKRSVAVLVEQRCPECGQELTEKEHLRSGLKGPTLHCENEDCDALPNRDKGADSIEEVVQDD